MGIDNDRGLQRCSMSDRILALYQEEMTGFRILMSLVNKAGASQGLKTGTIPS